MVGAMEAVAPADPVPRRRPSPWQSLRPRRFATGVASFDKGAWRPLPKMIAQVHQGEMIISTDPAVTLRRMMGGKQGRRRHGAYHHLVASHLSRAVSLPR